MAGSSASLVRSAGWGAALGLSAWSAYEATEFIFSSLLFSFTRPYAAFTPWHWHLTWLLNGAFILLGAVSGALAGVAVYVFGNPRESHQLELAAALTLVLAFLANLLTASRSQDGWYWLMAAAIVFAVLLALGMCREAWRRRIGYSTDPWVISGLLLGLGQLAVALNMGTAGQLGSHVRLLAGLLAGLLVALAIGSVIVGRVLRPRLTGWRYRPLVASLLAPAAAILLVGGSQWLSTARSAKVEAAPGIAATAKPNVLLIVMDTVRGDHLTIDGYNRPTTPNLGALARDSVVYTRAMSASDFTLTSHASLFTGLYPSWHGAYCEPPDAAYGRRLDDTVPTLAGLLTHAGYYTVAVAANLYMRSEFGLDRGFASFEIPRPVPVLTAENWYLLRRTARRLLSFGFDTSQFDRLYSRSEDIDQKLFSALAHRSGLAPFFAFMNYMDAHFPYVPPAPFDTEFPGKNRHVTEDDLDLEQQAIAGGAKVPAGYRTHTLSQYDGGIAYMDAQIGQLVSWLKREKAYDNTLIIVTSDHGEAFGERNHTGHANSPYQNLLHVALLVKYPGAPNGRTVDTPMSMVDVAPTVLEVLGVAAPASMQGRSLLDPSGKQPREFFSETFPCAVLQSPECPRGCIARSVFSWPYKFITMTNGRRQLYDLSSDPDETHDLYPSQTAMARKLNTDLHAWMRGFPDHPRQKLRLDPESLQRLKSLGYVQ